MRSIRKWSGSRHNRQSLQSEATTCIISECEYDEEQRGDRIFNPNHEKYLCCCGHAHSLTGMKIVAGMLCVTVVFELWHLIVSILASELVERADVTGAAIRFFAGVFIAGTVLWAIFAQRAEFLVPYLLLQGAGLAIGLIFFVSFMYIGLFGDKKVGTTVLGSYGIPVNPRDETAYFNYAAWLMAGSFAIVIVLQIWMMMIVVACWRFFRDKRNNEKIYKEVVTVKKIQLLTRMRISLSAEALGSESSHTKNWVKNRSFSASLDV
ncbi:Conserved plasma membrane protein [Caenorhabditis elegans]|uniref:Conserved plasma membrane protein n=1 Tax=Caenorhabditis elegans TaxID=6239 RepID=Q95YE0_CAEEL|nr:Conserved plasma membrane protein [Caenorhabditis elegans]CCD66232.1 Conserved plasma membrane protein [Caenorhabditis elegans]|eukprot:NP_491987.1 Uncharacterized protein CELE_C30F12.3 [Caenorhabditis elegans]